MSQEQESSTEFETSITQLIERCENAKIQYERKEFSGDTSFTVQLRNGRQFRPLAVRPKTINSLLSIPFEKYTYLGGYEAIACYERQTIEAAFKVAGGSLVKILERAFGTPDSINDSDDDNDAEPETVVTIDGGDFAPNCTITIGPCTDVFRQLLRSSVRRLSRSAISIQITGIPVSTYETAVETLEKLTNSLFFQVELARGITLNLRRRRRRLITRRQTVEVLPIEFPRTEYDSGPITLYWYGRSSLGMPLLQFLAFYQCVEFYFPTYYQAEQKRRIRNILKDPTFRPDREADIGRVLAVMNSSGRKGLPDEKSMLRATLHECLDAATMRSYLEESTERIDFFSKKTKGITDVKVPIGNVSSDLRDSVADRIYDIRCRIVHTKTGANDDVELLLPYSKEAQQLNEDIALLAFIAQNVLIAGSSTLQLPVDIES